LIEPLLPESNTGGHPEKHPRRKIVNAILYVVRSGCPWRYLPPNLPPTYLTTPIRYVFADQGFAG
jgi:transposase